jgi:hypothetical protein
MVATSKGHGSENDCVGDGQQHLETTDPSPRQRENPTSTNPQMSDLNKIMVVSPRWVLYSVTDWPNDRR